MAALKLLDLPEDLLGEIVALLDSSEFVVHRFAAFAPTCRCALTFPSFPSCEIRNIFVFLDEHSQPPWLGTSTVWYIRSHCRASPSGTSADPFPISIVSKPT